MDEVKKNQEILDRIRGKQETDSRHDGLLVDVFEKKTSKENVGLEGLKILL